MNRLGIVVLYDAEGILDRYVEALLSSLQDEIQEYVILINGYLEDESVGRLKRYTTKIYIRENLGFDAGAYKDAFLKFIPRNIWKSYDEIVLMNDTFFGPVISMKEVWKLFESDHVDFWGITRHPRQKLSDGSIVVESHIQSYFLVIKSRLITSRYFLEFWERLSYPLTYQEAVRNFEIEFSVFFESKGFCGKSLMDLKEGIALGEKTENPCFYSYELLKEYQVPFLKKKFLNLESPIYANMMDALEYIEKKTDYNTKLIWESLFRLSKEKRNWSVFSYEKLEKFYLGHTRIYIYGAGKYGKNLQRYFQYRRWDYECFLVSEHADEFSNCVNFKDVNITLVDGIILALGRKAFEEVYPVLRREVSEAQLMIPDYM